MELRQLRYFVRTVELGSINRAALDLGMVSSAVSQQLSRLEGELATRLLQRLPTGVVPTEAGRAFCHQAQLALRHADHAVAAAREARFAGAVSVGFAPTTAALLSQPFVSAMRTRYPHIRVHLVESLAGHLAAMLNARRVDLAILYQRDIGSRWSALPILDEQLFLLTGRPLTAVPDRAPVTLAQAAHLPLVTTSRAHGLRLLVEAAFERAQARPDIVLEIDGLNSLMDIVEHDGLATIQPGAALARRRWQGLHAYPIADPLLYRRNVVASLSDDDLAPAALAARVVLTDLMRSLAADGHWPGATLHDS